MHQSTGPSTHYSYRNYSAKEPLKLLVHNFCADVNATGVWNLLSQQDVVECCRWSPLQVAVTVGELDRSEIALNPSAGPLFVQEDALPES